MFSITESITRVASRAQHQVADSLKTKILPQLIRQEWIRTTSVWRRIVLCVTTVSAGVKNSIKSISTTLKSHTLKSSSSSSMFLLLLVVLLEMFWWDYFNLFSVDPLKTTANFSVLSSNHLFLISRLFSLSPPVVTCKLLLTCSLSTSPSQTFLSSSSVLLSPSSRMSPTLGSLEQSCAELSYSLRYYQSTFISMDNPVLE